MPAERIRIRRAAEIIGETVRTTQAMAARGQIPGAAKPARNWTFDERKLRSWLLAKEAECQLRADTRPVPIGEAGSCGQKSRLPAVNTGEPLALTIQKLQRAVSRHSARN